MTASVTQTSAALASTQGAIAGFQWIAKTGSGSGAGIEAVSISEAGVTTIEQVVLHGDVIAPQSISTSRLLITDLGFNKVPDDQLLSEDCWSLTSNFELRDSSRVEARSRGELRWNHPGGSPTGYEFASGLWFPVTAGEVMECP